MARAHVGVNQGHSMFVASGISRDFTAITQIVGKDDVYAPKITIDRNTLNVTFYNNDGGIVNIIW